MAGYVGRRLVNFVNDMVGTGYYGEKFGSIAYRDAFMGPMTFAPTVIRKSRTASNCRSISAVRKARPVGS
jgi:hypothetical protein